MKIAITPGPWETPGTDGEARVISYRTASRKRKTLAHVYQADIGDREATAYLIAAAPDLLEALQELMPIANNHKCRFHGPMICDSCTSYQKAKAAINKAEVRDEE